MQGGQAEQSPEFTGGTIIRNHEMLNQVQHDNGGKFSVTLKLFQGLMNTDTSALDYGLWGELVG